MTREGSTPLRRAKDGGLAILVLGVLSVASSANELQRFGNSTTTSSANDAGPVVPKCRLEEFQENHWNCTNRTFSHSCGSQQDSIIKTLQQNLAIFDNIHFAGDSLSRNRFMTASLELTGSLPLAEGVCPTAERTLESFILHARGGDCVHESYTHSHYVPPPYNLTLWHDNNQWHAKNAESVAPTLGSRDVMFLSIGAWINYDIAYHVPKIKEVVSKRPNGGELIFWLGMDAVGYLKPTEHLEKGQNNINAVAYNDYMKEHHKSLGFDGYIDFYNLTKSADECAQAEGANWANWDGTHATAGPNHMVFLGLLPFLQPFSEQMKMRQQQEEKANNTNSTAIMQ